MDPFFNHLAADEHNKDLLEAARRNGGVGASRRSVPRSVTVRYFEERDIEAIRRLAVLDGKIEPDGAVLVADVGGHIVAALPLLSGEAIADPFAPTADVVELLKLRAAQLTPPRPRAPRGIFGRFPLVSRAA
ncbi:MAG TPA: hypothetical protein VF752_15980 [Thermoleophilaceae bacterium]